MQPSEIVENWYETRDPALFAPEVAFHVCQTFPYGETYHGADAIYQQFFARLFALFDSFRVEREQMIANGDQVIVLGRYIGRFKPQDAEFSAPFTHVWTLSKGLVTEVRQHAETGIIDRALSAAA